MNNFYMRIKKAIDAKGITNSQVEKELGFSNAYLKNIKDETVPYHRLKLIADYLGISLESITTGECTEDPQIVAGFRDMMMLQNGELAECMRTINKFSKDKQEALYRLVKVM